MWSREQSCLYVNNEQFYSFFSFIFLFSSVYLNCGTRNDISEEESQNLCNVTATYQQKNSVEQISVQNCLLFSLNPDSSITDQKTSDLASQDYSSGTTVNKTNGRSWKR